MSYYDKAKIRIGIICDSLLYDTIVPAADFVYISPTDDWKAKLRSIEVFLVVSAWRGLHGAEWKEGAQEGTPLRRLLYEMIDFARSLGKKTVFYSKEDPPNFDVFLGLAKRCEYVFTSAREMIPRYICECGHQRVAELSFCINPDVQNPVGCLGRETRRGVVFSGSWMMKYPERCQELVQLFDGALDSGAALSIFNRNSYRPDEVRYRYPQKYAPFVFPAVAHDELGALHKSFDWSINVNSVTGSATMFAARCFELLAQGCPVISNFSYGMSRLLPEIAVAHTREDAAAILKESERERNFRRVSGIRRVMGEYTCYHWIARLLDGIGIDLPRRERRTLILVSAIDENVKNMFDRQTATSCELKEISAIDGEEYGRYDYVSVWDAAGKYAPYYIEDAVNVFKYADVDFATEGDPAYGYTEHCRNFHRTVFKVSSLPFRFLKDGIAPQNLKGFLLPPPEVDDAGVHMPEAARCIATVEIDVGGDRAEFRSRAFASLLRSRYFDRLRIVLRKSVTSNPALDEAVEGLAACYANVSVGEAAESAIPCVRISASDEFLVSGLDEVLDHVSGRAVGVVTGGVILCGRERHLIPDGFSVRCRSSRRSVTVKAPVLARYGDFDLTRGEPWRAVPPKKEPLWWRAYVCYNENGFWYTLRRIVCGKRS